MARPGLVGGQYQPLTQEQIERIHQASLAVLENTGVHVENARALALFLTYCLVALWLHVARLVQRFRRISL